MNITPLGPQASWWEPCCNAWRLRRLAHVGRGACVACRLGRLAPAALAACSAWSLRRLALRQRLATAASGDCGAWRHCLYGLASRPPEASRGPDESQSEFFSGCCQCDIVMIDRFWARWMLPTCSKMPYTNFIPTTVSLVWPLQASRGPDEPSKQCFGISPV